jgi:Ca2+-binding RTX toxin-like protein
VGERQRGRPSAPADALVANVLLGTPGNDVINCGSGDDRIDGGPGNDRGVGGSGRDSFAAVEERRQD